MNEIVKLYEEQQAEWEEFRLRVLQLDTVELKEIPMGNFSVFAQFNPARAVSSNAKLDAKSIANRKCFLCQQNRPDIQRGIALNERFEALVNPFPILKGHLTIVNREHRNQEILPVISDFIDFTKAMPHFTLFYNGPSCGASAPDHMHFQAVFRGQLPFEKVADRVNVSKDFWEAVKGNLDTVDEACKWHKVCYEEVAPDMEDTELTSMAASLLPQEPWDNNTYQIWMNLVKENTSKKGKDLFHPIRKALTAQENGPELKVLLPFIGRNRAVSRLNGNKA